MLTYDMQQLECCGYLDSGFAVSVDFRKIMFRYILMSAGRAVSRRSAKQSFLVTSIMKPSSSILWSQHQWLFG